MFAHKLSMYLKNDGALAFRHKIEGDIIPLLRKQLEFLEEIAFLHLNGREMHAFSLWESAEHAEAYHTVNYLLFVKYVLPHSCRTTVRSDLLTLILPLYSMKPSFLNLFMKKFTRERVGPTMLARVS